MKKYLSLALISIGFASSAFAIENKIALAAIPLATTQSIPAPLPAPLLVNAYSVTPTANGNAVAPVEKKRTGECATCGPIHSHSNTN